MKSASYRYDPPYDPDQFIRELEPVLQTNPGIDCLTFGYYGEPTLAIHLRQYLDLAKKLRQKLNRGDDGPVMTIFTNSSTIVDPKIQQILMQFELVIAKLDCATEILFRKSNRPHLSVPPIKDIIENLKNLRMNMDKIQSYDSTEKPHQLAIQTLLFKSDHPEIPSNYCPENLEALATAYRYIEPHRIQIYSVSRIPAEEGIHAILGEEKQNLRNFFTVKIPSRIAWRVY
jgi:wyosine [tRNA(Phe)-imidazoG37] synthetase (radical SAM superfamily)